MEEEKKFEKIPEVGNLPLEYIGSAQYLELNTDDLLDSTVREKMDFVYDTYKNYLEAEKKLAITRGEKELEQKDFLRWIIELSSKIGFKPEIHPLDKIYSYLKLYGLSGT